MSFDMVSCLSRCITGLHDWGEPSIHRKADSGFQDRCLQPLGHPSALEWETRILVFINLP